MWGGKEGRDGIGDGSGYVWWEGWGFIASWDGKGERRGSLSPGRSRLDSCRVNFPSGRLAG